MISIPNTNVQYQQSIGAEFFALKDRVRFFIENNHNGEDGRYKEIILMNYLRRIMPDNVAVGTGFVKNQSNELTSQIDIIVYKRNDPRLFSEGDFVILMPESVLGIIEVKSNATSNALCGRTIYGRVVPSTIDKCNRNGQIIGNRNIFNGIFSYEKEMSFKDRIHSVKLIDQLRQSNGFINHICFDDEIFMRYWADGNPMDRYYDKRSCYSFYELSYENIFNVQSSQFPGLAYGYFISNLLENVYSIVAPHVLSNQYFEFLYPLENTKEAYRIMGCELKL